MTCEHGETAPIEPKSPLMAGPNLAASNALRKARQPEDACWSRRLLEAERRLGAKQSEDGGKAVDGETSVQHRLDGMRQC